MDDIDNGDLTDGVSSKRKIARSQRSKRDTFAEAISNSVPDLHEDANYYN